MTLGAITVCWKTPNHVGREQDRWDEGPSLPQQILFISAEIYQQATGPLMSSEPLLHTTSTFLLLISCILGAPKGFISFKTLIALSVFFPEKLVQVFCSLAQEVTTTQQDTTSLPQHHEHLCISYLSKMAPKAPCLLFQSCTMQEGKRKSPTQVPQHSWGRNMSHLGHTAGAKLQLPHSA